MRVRFWPNGPWCDFSQRPLCGKIINFEEIQNGGNGHSAENLKITPKLEKFRVFEQYRP